MTDWRRTVAEVADDLEAAQDYKLQTRQAAAKRAVARLRELIDEEEDPDHAD